MSTQLSTLLGKAILLRMSGIYISKLYVTPIEREREGGGSMGCERGANPYWIRLKRRKKGVDRSVDRK